MIGMDTVREQEGFEALYRVLRCDCGRCESYAIVGCHDDAPDLWTVMGKASHDDLEEAMARLAEGELDPFVGTCAALVGVPFEWLSDAGRIKVAQEAWVVLPDWMMRLDPAGVRELRRWVTGDRLVRVPAALLVLRAAGDPLRGGCHHEDQEGVLLAPMRLVDAGPSGGWQG